MGWWYPDHRDVNYTSHPGSGDHPIDGGGAVEDMESSPSIHAGISALYLRNPLINSFDKLVW
jgi:hypothetical protein